MANNRRPVATRRRPTRGTRETDGPPPTGEGEVVAPVERKAVEPFQITPVEPVDQRWLNMLIYGEYGHGKTTFAGSALDVPSMNDVLFINADSGTMSLTGRRSLDTININKYKQIARIFEYLNLHCMWRDQGNTEKLLEHERRLKATVIPVSDQTEPVEEGRTWFEEQRLRVGKPMDEPFMYRTVVVDSLSEVYKYLIYLFTGVDIGKTKLDEEIERMEEWQSAQEMFRLFIRSFRDLPMHSILVSAQTIVDPDRKKGERHAKILPKLAGQMAGDVAGFIDIVGYLERTQDKEGGFTRRLYLGAGYEGWISKHRFTNLPDLEYVENPTLTSLIELSRKDAEYGTSDTLVVEGRRPVPSAVHASGSAAAQRRSGAHAAQGSRGSRRGNAVRRSR